MHAQLSMLFARNQLTDWLLADMQLLFHAQQHTVNASLFAPRSHHHKLAVFCS